MEKNYSWYFEDYIFDSEVEEYINTYAYLYSRSLNDEYFYPDEDYGDICEDIDFITFDDINDSDFFKIYTDDVMYILNNFHDDSYFED